ncbi:hypothetical protein STENM36S_06319 [Streptomyces tendae]
MTEQQRTTTPPKPGTCDTGRPLCGKPARFYPAGWRCDDHVPTSPTRNQQ